jgi:dephospho-CoA kinase
VRLYGLTGGIASGKSTAARFFAERGVPIIDADHLARELVEPGRSALLEIVQRWPGVVDAGGRLDRKALAGVVFADPEKRLALESILHPQIRAETLRRAKELESTGHVYALYEAALILETGTEGLLDGVILVSASPATQRARLAQRNDLLPEDAERRMAAQLPLEEKRQRSRWILENDGSKESLRESVIALDAELRGIGP